MSENFSSGTINPKQTNKQKYFNVSSKERLYHSANSLSFVWASVHIHVHVHVYNFKLMPKKIDITVFEISIPDLASTFLQMQLYRNAQRNLNKINRFNIEIQCEFKALVSFYQSALNFGQTQSALQEKQSKVC